MAINGGKDEKAGVQIGPEMPVYEDEYLDYDKVSKRLSVYMSWIAEQYVSTMNVIHFMHDKYAYERTQLALHDTDVERLMAFGVAGLSVIADSLSAIKYARVKTVRNDEGMIVDYITEGEYPTYGNDDDRVDSIAKDILHTFITELKKTPTYRDAKHTLSALTITSNVVYGKKTGSTPDGRRAGEPFAPGANPMHNREKNGALASLNSVAKMSYEDCRDGISNTFSIVPSALGKSHEVKGLVTIPTVRISNSRATRATTGAAPVPVPPPIPAVINTMSVPSSIARISSIDSSAARAPIWGFAPAPKPLVIFSPITS